MFQSWAEDNLVVSSSRTCKCTGWVILRVTISIRAPTLKKPREVCRATSSRIATILISLEHSARVVAPS